MNIERYIRSLRTSEISPIANGAVIFGGIAALLAVGAFHLRIIRAQGPSNPPGDPDIARTTSTTVPETVLWKPVPGGFSVDPPPLRLVRAELLICAEALEGSTPSGGSVKREGPGVFFNPRGTAIPEGTSVKVKEVIKARDNHGGTTYWGMQYDNEPILEPKGDGNVTSYVRITSPYSDEPGLGVNTAPEQACQPVSDTSFK